MTDSSDRNAARTGLPVNRRDVLRSIGLAALLSSAGTTATATPTQTEGDVAPTEATPLSEYRENVVWYRTGDKSGREKFRAAVSTPDGGVTTLGLATTSDGGAESWQYTWDADGETRWTTSHGQAGFDVAYGGARTATNGYVLCGATGGRCAQQMYVVETNRNGRERWTQRFQISSTADDRANDVVQTPDGGFVVAGTSGGRAALAKLGSDGAVRWTRTYAGGTRTEIASVTRAQDGFTLAGTRTSDDDTTEFLMVRTDAAGRERWRTSYAANEDNRLEECIRVDGGYVLAGTTGAADAFTTDALFVKTAADGDAVWTKTHGEDGQEFTADGIVALEDGYAAVGTRSVDVVGPQMWLNGLDGSGNRTWTYTFGTERAEQPHAITAMDAEHLGICGSRNPPQRRDEYDGFVAKVRLPE
ncbi:hypothetical protein [Haloferax sp. ATB1]|uniref:hypothetical protein n=1 Tax=Haloferax sp. ATB1 TaxID=1508454 RepID=UPI0012FF1905|nr:hypothetical protein [Haloferax sp. ATB1]